MSDSSWESIRKQAMAAHHKIQNQARQTEPKKGVRKAYSYEQLLKDDPSGMTMLDQALEGASDQEKARVRGLLLRFGIEPDHEFYVIFVAIGQLLVLVEEAPENWRAFFDEVHQKLKQWSQENFNSLESIKQHTQTSAELIVVLKRLLDSMKLSDDSSNQTSTTLNALALKLGSIESCLDAMSRVSHSNPHQLDRLSRRIDALSGTADRRTWLSISSAGIAGLTLFILMATSWTMGWQLNQQAKMIERQTMMMERQGDELNWLLDKANRQECLNGLKPASDPQCQQFF